MAKFAIFSDLHIHPFLQFSTLRDGLNSRLVEIAGILACVLDGAMLEGCDAVLFAGDWFHTKRIDAETLDTAARTLMRYDIPIIAISGNHDESDAMGRFSSLNALRGRIRVLEDQKCRVDGVTISGHPFVRDRALMRSKLSKGSDIVLIHHGISNALMGSDFVSDEGFMDVDSLLDMANLITISGHYHMPQWFCKTNSMVFDQEQTIVLNKGSLLIPGAPLQHNFGDAGQSRGMWILDCDEERLTFQPLPGPRFIKADHNTTPDRTPGTKYVSLELPAGMEKEEIDRLKAKWGEAQILVNFKKNETKSEQRIDVSLTSTIDDVLEKYVDSVKPSIPRDMLLARGRGFLK